MHHNVKKSSSLNECLGNKIKLVKNFTDVNQINLPDNTLEKIYLTQSEILSNHNHRFILNNDLMELMKYCDFSLGDFCDCVTGIYTGNNKRFMAVTKENVRNAKGYPIISSEDIDQNHMSLDPLKNGKRYIPIVKSSSDVKYKRNNNPWLIDWTTEAIDYYHNDKKARFQNSQYYFKHGIAVPMVKSSVIKATEMNKMVFDQSIVGVFPRKEKYFNYVLGLINSDIGNKIIHLINPTANNSANYLKKIPFILPNESQLDKINQIVKKLKLNPIDADLQQRLDDTFDEIYYSYTPSKTEYLF